MLRAIYHSLKSAAQPNGVPREINGQTFRVDHRHFLTPDIDSQAARLLRERVKRRDVCLNVGANTGLYVLQWSRWSEGPIYAFEPNPAAVKTLRRHINMNGIANAKIIEAAVGAKAGTATLYAAGDDGMARLESPNPLIRTATRPITVPVVTLDDFCEAEGVTPDWVIMDIEGFEIAALRGARRLLRSGAQFVVELHPDIWEKSDRASRAELESILQEHALEVVPLSGQSEPLAEHGLIYFATRPFR